MAKPIITLNGLKIVIMLGMLVIILTGVRFAADIIVPFILALFIAVILNPLVQRMTRLRVPRVLAITLLISIIIVAMVLLVAIGKQFINHYYAQISEGVTSQELAVMLVIALILLFLVNKVPSMISGIVTGASLGAIGGAGSFGAGAAMGLQ